MDYDPLPDRRPAPSDAAAPGRTTPGAPPPAAGGSPPGGPPPRGSGVAGVRRRRLLKWVWPAAAAAVAGMLSGIGFAAAVHVPRVESVVDFTPSLITQLRARDGEVFTTYARERRVLLEEGEVPPLLAQAIIAVEDSSFYQHGGVDALAVARAQLANLRAGRIVEGAGTLTMQLARELFLSRERTWRRKIEEAFLAVELEKTFTKQQILTLYLNLVNFGHGNYGVAAAARYYFDKSVDELELHEVATLAGIIQRPSEYSPYRRPEVVEQRRNKVLQRMRDEGFVDRERYRQAVAEPLLVVSHRPRDRLGSYFAEEVRKALDEAYGTTAVVEGGLDVETTLDPTIQHAAEEALRRGLVRLDHRKGWRGPVASLTREQPGEQKLAGWHGGTLEPGRWAQGIVTSAEGSTARVQIEDATYTLTPEGISWTGRARPRDLLKVGDVAWFRLEEPAEDEGEPLLRLEQEPDLEGVVLVLESATGAVRAMVGGWDYERSKFNRATQAQRQVGSAFKPFVYAAALELGFTPADTLYDAPTAFLGADARLSYRPRNYYRSYFGIITLRRALELSANVSAVKLLDLVGVERVISLARRSGIRSDLPPYPSLALGTADVTPLEIAAAYAAIANHGTYVEPYLVDRVTAPDGRLLEQHVPSTSSAMDPRVAYVLTAMLEGVVDRGTAAKLAPLDLDLAGKTGTTDDYSDAWFVGFTPRYTLLTWVGYDRKRSIGRNMTGAEAALPIWKAVAEDGLERGWLSSEARFTPPPGIVLQTVEYRSGLLAGPGAGRLIEEAFVAGTEPVQQYTSRWAMVMSLPWYQQRPFYIPKERERMPSGTVSDEEAEEARAAAPPDELRFEGQPEAVAPAPESDPGVG